MLSSNNYKSDNKPVYVQNKYINIKLHNIHTRQHYAPIYTSSTLDSSELATLYQ